MNILKSLLPYLAGLIILAAWYSLIIVGKAPAQPFLGMLKIILGAGGVHVVHLAKNRNAANKADKTDTP